MRSNELSIETVAPRRDRSLMTLATTLLRLFPPEVSQRLAIHLFRLSSPFMLDPSSEQSTVWAPLLARLSAEKDDPRLSVSVMGLNFPNPIGLAAGFDKNAELCDATLKLGFGFAECGTITPRPQQGNPTPRLFRLEEDEAVINRMGFNNDGVERAAHRLSLRTHAGIVGINIGANSDSIDRMADYVAGFRRLAGFADYVTINVSSPNTPGLRGLQARSELTLLTSNLIEEREKLGLKLPFVLKIAPDLDEAAVDEIAQVVVSSGLEGVIVSNTTITRPAGLRSSDAKEVGGLSGKPLFKPSTMLLREMRKRVGARVTLIGAGGISSGADAYAKIKSGASLVQLYTAFAYRGPDLVKQIKRELLCLLVRDGYPNVSAAIGADVH